MTTARQPLSLFQQHAARWGDCQQCELGQTRTRIVLARGTVPCDVLFVGEAPGSSEDVLGLPFVGPAGQLLDKIVERAVRPGLRLAFTNLLCCLPVEDGKKAKGGLNPEHVEACSERLSEFIELADPCLIVCVGNEARDYLSPGYRHSIQINPGVKLVSIMHPSAILHRPVAARGLDVQRCVVQVAAAVREVFGPTTDPVS